LEGIDEDEEGMIEQWSLADVPVSVLDDTAGDWEMLDEEAVLDRCGKSTLKKACHPSRPC
jgi:hypothetical protein